MRPWRNDSRALTHVCRQSNVLICITDSSLTTTYHNVDKRSLSPKFALQPWYAAQTNVRLGRCLVDAASHECRPCWMTSQWSAPTNHRPLFHTRYFCYTIEKFHGTFHTCMNSYVEDFIRVYKIPWMILHNDTRIKSYTYEKLHVWKVTRMKNYTYEKLYVLNIELWLVHCYTRIDSFTEHLIRVKIHTRYILYV